MHGSSSRRKKLLNTDADYYIINHDGFSIIEEQSLNKFDLIIVDEAAAKKPINKQIQNAQEVY